MDDRLDGLWRYYDEHASQARQHEQLRAAVTSALVGVTGAMIALAGVGGLTLADIPTGVAIVAIGGLGVLLSLKHYEQNRFHTTVMGETRKEIDALARSGSGGRSTADIRRQAKRDHSDEHKWLSKLRLHGLWAALPGGLALLGLIVIVLAITGVPGTID